MAKKYRYDFSNITTAGQVLAEGCNAISFYNPATNTGTLLVRDTPIPSGCHMMLAGDPGEEDHTIYDVSFASAGANDKYFVIRKFYFDTMKK